MIITPPTPLRTPAYSKIPHFLTEFPPYKKHPMKTKISKKRHRKSPKSPKNPIQISSRINREVYETPQFPKWDW